MSSVAPSSIHCDFVSVSWLHLKIPAAAVGLCYLAEGIQRMMQRLGSTLVRKLWLTTESVSFEDAQHNAFDWLVAQLRSRRNRKRLSQG